MGRKLLKTVQAITTFRNPLADQWEPVADPLWSADPSLKTAGIQTGGYRANRSHTYTILVLQHVRFPATAAEHNCFRSAVA